MSEREPSWLLPEHAGFAPLLRQYRERTGKSRNALAKQVGVDPLYCVRMENGGREPPRPAIIEALARALRLSTAERKRLLIAGGYAPPEVVEVWGEAMEGLSDLMGQGWSESEAASLNTAFATIFAHMGRRA